MFKIGDIVEETVHNYLGIIDVVFENWNDLKIKNNFLTIEKDDEMDYFEKLIHRDQEDEWLRIQTIPFEKQQLFEKWFTVSCFDGGAIWTCKSRLKLINSTAN